MDFKPKHKTLTKKEVITAITQEINWCIKNREKKAKNDCDGFIKGLRQSIYLVRELQINLKD